MFRNIRDKKRQLFCGCSGCCEPSSLGGREMLSYCIDRGDGRTRFNEGLVARGGHLERHILLHKSGDERRTAAADEKDNEIVRGQRSQLFHDRFRCYERKRVGNGVTCTVILEPLGLRYLLIRGDDDSFKTICIASGKPQKFR